MLISKLNYSNELKINTVCPRSLDPIHIVTYNIKWVKTSWTVPEKIQFLHIESGWQSHNPDYCIKHNY